MIKIMMMRTTKIITMIIIRIMMVIIIIKVAIMIILSIDGDNEIVLTIHDIITKENIYGM